MRDMQTRVVSGAVAKARETPTLARALQRAERAARSSRAVLRVVERPLCPARDVHLVCVLDPRRASSPEHQAHATDPERPAEEEDPEFGHGTPYFRSVNSARRTDRTVGTDGPVPRKGDGLFGGTGPRTGPQSLMRCRFEAGRSAEIRTRDPLHPMQVRYQTAPRSDRAPIIRNLSAFSSGPTRPARRSPAGGRWSARSSGHGSRCAALRRAPCWDARAR